jgi:bifunctional DNase/RNase
MRTATRPRFVEMRIADVLKAPAQPDCYIVVLEERGGDRRLLIWIGGAEATSMALRLAGTERPARPLGADLGAALVRALGGRLTEIRIDRLDGGTFYATVALEGPQGPAEVDARPSDALNLALVLGAPVRVDGGVLDRAAAEVDRLDLPLPPMPAPGSTGAPGARAIIEELLSG